MRIITGKYKGRPLATVPDQSVRPATDRVRGMIFNVLQNRLRVEGSRVLDAFAGSGSLGEEAVAAYRESLTLDPVNADVRYSLAQELADLGRKAEAVEQLRQAMSLAPQKEEIRKLYQTLSGDGR